MTPTTVGVHGDGASCVFTQCTYSFDRTLYGCLRMYTPSNNVLLQMCSLHSTIDAMVQDQMDLHTVEEIRYTHVYVKCIYIYIYTSQQLLILSPFPLLSWMCNGACLLCPTLLMLGYANKSYILKMLENLINNPSHRLIQVILAVPFAISLSALYLAVTCSFHSRLHT